MRSASLAGVIEVRGGGAAGVVTVDTRVRGVVSGG